jgi:hypothetical protein
MTGVAMSLASRPPAGLALLLDDVQVVEGRLTVRELHVLLCRNMNRSPIVTRR